MSVNAPVLPGRRFSAPSSGAGAAAGGPPARPRSAGAGAAAGVAGAGPANPYAHGGGASAAATRTPAVTTAATAPITSASPLRVESAAGLAHPRRRTLNENPTRTGEPPRIQSPPDSVPSSTFSVVAAMALGGAVDLSLRAQRSGLAAPPAPASPAITAQDLRDGLKNPARWLTFSGDLTGQRHSALTQITPANVAKLAPQWLFQTDVPGFPGRGLENSPLIVDGVAYVTGNNNQAFALDARTGRPIWKYRRTLPQNFSASVCCGPVNRGFAMLGDRLYMGTLDAHLVALDRKTGAVIWDVAVGDLKKANAITAAPLVVKEQSDHRRRRRRLLEPRLHRRLRRADRRARVALQHDPRSRRARQRVVAESPTWPRAAARAVWVTGSYDPDLNLVYYGTGNPNPNYYGDDRAGDNLYSCSLARDRRRHREAEVALPVHAARHPRLGLGARARAGGPDHRRPDAESHHGRQPQRLLLHAQSRDRESCSSRSRSSTARTGRRKSARTDGPIVLDNVGTPDKCLPDNHGGTNFQPPTFDPIRKLFFVTAHETCAIWTARKPTPPIELGVRVPSGGRRLVEGKEQWGALRAIDPTTGARKWEHRYRSYPSTVSLDLTGGLMSTASGLVFTGDNDGFFYAFDAATGKELWRSPDRRARLGIRGGHLHARRTAACPHDLRD